MFKKTMTFDDLDGNEVTQTFYFNYTKKEIAELLVFGELLEFPSGRKPKPLEEQLKDLGTPMEVSGLTQVENNQMAYDTFQDLLLNAYGEKAEDNVRFIKNQQTREYFRNHLAFVELIFEMVEDTKLMNEFIEGCLPPKAVAAAKSELAKDGAEVKNLVEAAAERQANPETAVAPAEKPKQLTPEDIASMSDEDFAKLDVQKLDRDQMMAAFKRKSQQ